MTWSVIGDDEGVDLFFRSLSDFEVVSGGRHYTVTPDTVWDPGRLKVLSEHKCSAVSIAELSNIERNLLLRSLDEKKLADFLSLEGRKLGIRISFIC